MTRRPLPIGPLRHAARLLGAPLRRLARVQSPAVRDAAALRPGDPPPTDGRLLLLFDGGCGVCLHGRDLLTVLDRRHRLAHDTILRHEHGLLADLTAEQAYGSWHAVHPGGRIEHGAAGVAAALAEVPGGRLPARVLRRQPRAAQGAYAWFVRHRAGISQALGLVDHPQRDPREQPDHPLHHEVIKPRL